MQSRCEATVVIDLSLTIRRNPETFEQLAEFNREDPEARRCPIATGITPAGLCSPGRNPGVSSDRRFVIIQDLPARQLQVLHSCRLSGFLRDSQLTAGRATASHYQNLNSEIEHTAMSFDHDTGNWRGLGCASPLYG